MWNYTLKRFFCNRISYESSRFFRKSSDFVWWPITIQHASITSLKLGNVALPQMQSLNLWLLSTKQSVNRISMLVNTFNIELLENNLWRGLVKNEGHTGDGPADLGGRRFPHLQRGLLTVPCCVWRADQIGCVLQRTLTKTEEPKRDKMRFLPFLKTEYLYFRVCF